jgi:protein SCO1/2
MRTLAHWVAAVALTLPAFAHAGLVSADRESIELLPAPAGGDFRLDSAQGPVDLQSLRGQAVLLFFGYTTCRHVCPTTFGTLRQAMDLLEESERRRVRVLFVSVDPERDTPAVLNAYLASMPFAATGLTGSRTQLAAVAGQYGAQFRKLAASDAPGGYSVDHSSAIYLVDPRGRLKLMLRHTATPARFAAEIRRLLRPYDD